MKKYLTLFILPCLLLSACGQPTISLDPADYQEEDNIEYTDDSYSDNPTYGDTALGSSVTVENGLYSFDVYVIDAEVVTYKDNVHRYVVDKEYQLPEDQSFIMVTMSISAINPKRGTRVEPTNFKIYKGDTTYTGYTGLEMDFDTECNIKEGSAQITVPFLVDEYVENLDGYYMSSGDITFSLQ